MSEDNVLRKAYKYRIYPSDAQASLINKTIGASRFIYNRMLKDKIAYYEETKQMLKCNPANYKKEHPWLKEVDSLALTSAWTNLNTAYNNFFHNPKRCATVVAL